jgi:hypothetical protein
MVRSKSSRKRARQNAMSIPYARMRPGAGLSNWVVGSQALSSTGQVIGGLTTPTNVPTWFPSSSGATYNLATASPVTFQATVISAGVSTATPTIGRQKVDEIKGKILFSQPSTPAYYVVAVGIYISEFTLNTSAWDVYDPLAPSDAARDDFWFLDARTFTLVPANVSTADSFLELDISCKLNLVIGGGQAVNVTVSMISVAGSTLYCNPAFRTRVGPVA